MNKIKVSEEQLHQILAPLVDVNCTECGVIDNHAVKYLEEEVFEVVKEEERDL